MNHIRKRMIGCTMLIALILSGSVRVLARPVEYAPYMGYEYNNYEESRAAPVGYVPNGIINSKSLGLEEPMNDPSDFVYDGTDNFYILDSGNGRILALNSSLTLRKILGPFAFQDGSIVDFKGAQGLAVDKAGRYYIADTENNRVLIISPKGMVERIIERPDEALVNTDAPFKATKVQVDAQGQILVIAESINLGIMVFSPEGEFVTFFGSNTIKVTAEVIKNFVIKKFLTKEQRKAIREVTPVNYLNMTLDSKGFIYTVSADKNGIAESNMLRRMNYKGSNVLIGEKDLLFGDLEWNRNYFSNARDVNFCDVSVESEGFIYLLDKGKGKVLQYTKDGQMMTAMGAYGNQSGTFGAPKAVEAVNGTVYVLDGGKNCIHHFIPTRYAIDLRKAFLLTGIEDASASRSAWEAVLRQNSNSRYPYYGIGMAYDSEGRYQEAMEQFRIGNYNSEYSKAFREYRKEFINRNLVAIAAVGVLIIGLLVWLARILKKRFSIVEGSAFSLIETKYAFPVYTAVHPIEGFDQFKTRKLQSYRLSILLVFLWLALETALYFFTGVPFNKNRITDYSAGVMLLKTVIIFCLFIVSNWSVCTLLSGKGSFKEIVSVTAYALLPLLASILLKLILSNLLIQEEAAFLGVIMTLGYLWTFIILFCGMYSIHQYSFSQTLGALLLTIFGMAVLAFLIMLFLTLMQQVVNFVSSIFSEISLRYS